MSGRRIYIHEFSFITLASRDARAAALIFDSLLRTKAAKMINSTNRGGRPRIWCHR